VSSKSSLFFSSEHIVSTSSENSHINFRKLNSMHFGKQPYYFFFFLLLPLLALPAGATNHYVRQGASGNGSDWTNACGDFTGSCAIASLVRGDTYYVGAGTYNARTWNTPASGTSVITIKKAIVADHGTATGWSDAYAAQASFTNRMDVETAYWTFDGQVGDYNTGGIGSYGFKDQYNVGDFAPCGGSNGGTAGAGFLLCGDHVTIRYFDCSGYTGTGDYNYPNQAKCIESYGGSFWTVSHVAMHGCESCLQGGATGALLEYSYIYNSRSIAPNFHNNVFYIQGLQNSTLRYNKVWDYNAEGFFFTGYSGATNSNVAIYGNVFWSDGSQSNFPRGIEIRQDYNYDHILIYNNTFYNLNDGAVNNLTGSTGNTCANCQAVDNLAVLTGYSFGSGFTANSNTSDSNISRFVSVASLYTADFHLKSALAGVSLASPYNIDMDGNTPGTGGSWDRGAYQYVVSNQPSPPTGLQGTVQ
jgi:hypothetical protein